MAGGVATWLIAAVVTEVTGDNILVPTVIIVGRFLVPVTMAAFALSRRRAGYLWSVIGATWVVLDWRRYDRRGAAATATTASSGG